MGRRGPKPMSPELRALKGYGPRLPVDRPATAPDPERLDEWLASLDCPLNWLEKRALYEPAAPATRVRKARRNPKGG